MNRKSACAVVVVLAGFLCVFAKAAWAGAAETPGTEDAVERLTRLADPRADDWDTETFERDVAGRLDELVRRLVAGPIDSDTLTAIATPEARATALWPDAARRRDVAGRMGLVRFVPEGGAADPDRSLADALTRLSTSLGAGERRIKFKVVGVNAGKGPAPETLLRYEAAVRSPQGVLQQVATWRVAWRRDAGGLPRFDAVRLERFDELRGIAPLFTECTNGVLPAGAPSVERLSRGGEFWHGRIDALGEPNLMGHQGIAVGDADGDGLEDLYVAQGTGLPNLLLLQNADGSVRDAAEAAGVAWLDDTKGVLFADMDNDGDQDLLAAIGPTIVLAKNDGHARFDRFVALRAPTPAAFYSLSVADYDLDGDLDIFGARYVKVSYGISVPMPFHDAENGPTNHLLRNDGKDQFTDVTVQTGMNVNNTRFSLVGAWADYDDDGDPDLYVANDFGRNNLYRNDSGHFSDVAASAGAEDQAAGMGASWSDYDLDGDLDLHVTNMYSSAGKRIAYQPRFQAGADAATRSEIQHHSLGNTLLENTGDGKFRDVSDEAGVRMGRWGWGARFVDLDDDGQDDIVVPNGFLTGALKDDL